MFMLPFSYLHRKVFCLYQQTGTFELPVAVVACSSKAQLSVDDEEAASVHLKYDVLAVDGTKRLALATCQQTHRYQILVVTTVNNNAETALFLLSVNGGKNTLTCHSKEELLQNEQK